MSTARAYRPSPDSTIGAPHVFLRLRRLTFTSYRRFLAAACAAVGSAVGVVGFAASLAGAPLFIHLLPFFHVNGVTAGILGLVVMPTSFALLGVVAAAVTYFPLNFVLRLTGGLVIEGEA